MCVKSGGLVADGGMRMRMRDATNTHRETAQHSKTNILEQEKLLPLRLNNRVWANMSTGPDPLRNAKTGKV